MDSDVKWFVILMAVVMGVPLIGLGIERYQLGQCRMEAIRAHMPAEQIEKVCK